MATIKIGDEFPSLKGGVITVLSVTENHCICSCSICNNDTELFPEPFTLTKHSVRRGKGGCGCHNSFRFNEEEATLLVERSSLRKGYIFKGFTEGYVNKSSKIMLVCPKGHEWNATSMYNFLLDNTACSSCFKKYIAGSTLKHDWLGKQYTSPSGSIIRVVEKLSARNIRLHCSVCSTDLELFPEGFIQDISGFSRRTPCLCSSGGSYQYTKEQYLILCKRACNRLKDRKFLGFNGTWDGCDTKVSLECTKNENHGSWNTSSIDKLIRRDNRGCPDCAKDGSAFGRYKHRDYELDTLYLLRFTREDEVFIKCGRTFELSHRLQQMGKDYDIEVLSTHKAIHHHISILEKAMHNAIKEHHLLPKVHFGGSKNECFDVKCLENISIKSLFNV